MLKGTVEKTRKEFNSDNFLYLQKKCASHFSKYPQLEKIKFSRDNDGYLIHSLSDKALRIYTIVNKICNSRKGSSYLKYTAWAFGFKLSSKTGLILNLADFHSWHWRIPGFDENKTQH